MSTWLNNLTLNLDSSFILIFTPLVIVITLTLAYGVYSVSANINSNIFNDMLSYRIKNTRIKPSNFYTIKKFALFTSTPLSMFGLSSSSILFSPNLVLSKLNYHFFEYKDILFRARKSRYELRFENLFEIGYYNAERVLYYIRNWVYSTNHKRIAVNYFWFVILSGVCGMILATIIRLEMAYPGIGVLAGDSLQYLSVVTAHAVIMVFFMIMPLLFGAFGNFLLPTQLGVHDVAFPRLNSAAFWFLPGGLLMLAQLVCLDRRYQRMNCFNIRELQTLLKNRYHPELLDDKLHTDFLSQTTLSTRFKLFNLNNITPRMAIFNEYPLFKSSEPTNSTSLNAAGSIKNSFISTFSFNQLELNLLSGVNSLFLNYSVYQPLSNLTLSSRNTSSSYSTESSFSSTGLAMGLTQSFKMPNLSANSSSNSFLEALLSLMTENPLRTFVGALNLNSLYFIKDSVSQLDLLMSNISRLFINVSQPETLTENKSQILNKTSMVSVNENLSMLTHELGSDYRFQKTQNPIFRYDFKVGNYMNEGMKILGRHVFTTFNDVTGGLRMSPWMYSEVFENMFLIDLYLYTSYFSNRYLDLNLRSTNLSKVKNISDDYNPYSSSNASPAPTTGFYNFFNSLSYNSGFLNTRWVSLNNLDQKFHNMYASSSMQQRVYSNWRQLKFTREAWRCKLLASRHQNTLYKRYVHEDSVFWSVERNAKDVLPGWAMITPFSARTRFTAIGKVDIGLMGVFLVLNSSIVSSANFLVTYRYLSTLNNRKMRDARSFFTEGVMVASWMMIAANPMLAIGIIMLLSDRHWQTSFFDYSGGGDTVLFQHMFWFFGHPEVYVIMIPTFGFNNTILSYYLRKRVSARASLMYSMYTIAFLGFFVWGHHMYMVGLGHTTRMLFSTLTVMISVPAATKLMHWCVTIVNSSITLELPLIFQFLFIFFFVSGGVSGMCVAHTGMDILFHDSFYVVGHFHVMLAGAAMLASFGAFYFYFPSIFGVKFSRIFGYLHLIYYLLGQLMTVIPMFWLGYASMPRRVLDYPASMGGWHAIVSAGHLLSVAGMMAFFIMIFDSLRGGRAVVRSSFGVARFNTRLNFYIYEGARTWFLQRKGWHNARTQIRDELDIEEVPYKNFEVLETTLFSYVILNQKNVRIDKEKERREAHEARQAAKAANANL